MADRPIESLGGRTPLEYAKTPKMDELAAKVRSAWYIRSRTA